MLESLLEASRHLLVPEMSQNKAVAIARQVVGSLLQVRLEQRLRSSHNRPKGYLGQFLLDIVPLSSQNPIIHHFHIDYNDFFYPPEFYIHVTIVSSFFCVLQSFLPCLQRFLSLLPMSKQTN